ncbi:zinc finger, C2H2 type [Dictyocaulus viviparus]|uniref:Zinc finger, C2H2 type n=1 Tax=Dictyocaulus viviparus TaxID=29172 RepID=A0A0D8XVH1_DICVI|nr:zinc finger, C2H2 type [Dictyocaulus viviparus]
MARIEELGLETFQCQLCKKAITRQGQLSNLVNHLSRHSRLHASRKQYCYVRKRSPDKASYPTLLIIYHVILDYMHQESSIDERLKTCCSCPVCRASFTRRYLAYSHVREAHSKHGHVEPVDYGKELREEYHALLEVCFPGASIRRKRRADDGGHYGSDVEET